MKTKKLLLWGLHGIILLFLTFIILAAIDYFFLPGWLTDSLVIVILVLEILIHCATGIARLKATHKNTKGQTHVKKSKGRYPKRKNKGINKNSFVISTICILFIAILAFGSYKLINYNNLKNVPEDIVEFGEKYPEAQGYVNDFNKYANKDFDMDVSEEMSKDNIPLFIQWDKRWGYKNYGESYVGVAGCGPTCMAMVACGLKDDSEINPYVVATYSYEQGYYTYGQGTSWLLMTDGAEHFGLDVIEGSVSSEFILNNLSEETPMICSMGPGDFTTSGHFIVLIGIDSDGKIIVNDSNSPNNSSKHWEVDTLVSQMKAVWKYSIS